VAEVRARLGEVGGRAGGGGGVRRGVAEGIAEFRGRGGGVGEEEVAEREPRVGGDGGGEVAVGVDAAPQIVLAHAHEEVAARVGRGRGDGQPVDAAGDGVEGGEITGGRGLRGTGRAGEQQNGGDGEAAVG
jgi:hypothetical protein